MTSGKGEPDSTVSRVVDIFSGTLTLDDGARVPVELGVDDENLLLRTEGRMIGTWPLKYCRVSRSGSGAVLLSVDGEKTVFEPDDIARFSTVAAQRFRASSLADRISVIRDVAVDGSGERPGVGDAAGHPDGARWWWRIPRWGLVIVATVAVVGLGVFVSSRLGGSDTPGFAGTTITVASTAVAPPPLFSQSVEQFANEWNLTATAFGVPVQIRGALVPGQFESQLTPHLTLQGRTDPDDTIGALVLVIDPTGDTEDDQMALSALGVAIAVANPELDREERGELLAAMGLSVREPDLTDLDGEARAGTTTYTITYFEAFEALLFTVAPA